MVRLKYYERFFKSKATGCILIYWMFSSSLILLFVSSMIIIILSCHQDNRTPDNKTPTFKLIILFRSVSKTTTALMDSKHAKPAENGIAPFIILTAYCLRKPRFFSNLSSFLTTYYYFCLLINNSGFLPPVVIFPLKFSGDLRVELVSIRSD